MRQRKTHETHRGFAALLLSLCAIASTFAVALPAKAAADDVYVPKAPGGQREAPTLEEAASLVDNGGTIYLTGNTTVDTATFDDKTVTILSDGNGPHTVTKSGSGENMLVLSAGANVTLQNVVIDATENKGGRTVRATGGSTLKLSGGAVLENNKTYGAVYLDNSAINVDGGEIRDNAAGGEALKKTYPACGSWGDTTRYIFNSDSELADKQGLGGAVLMVNGSRLTMTGGEISGNTATAGGAVYAYKKSDITLNGGTFSGNEAKTTDGSIPATGGALSVDGEGPHSLTVNGANFTGNIAGRGGAIFLGVDAGTVDLKVTKGEFSGNRVSGDGSVIYSAAADGVMDISGEETIFTQNKAGGNGGICQGMYPGNPMSDRAKIYLHDKVKFTQNEAKKGSCVYATKDGGIKTLMLDGAVFSYNEATDDAGVIQYNIPNSVFTVQNCMFMENKSGNRGGCFYITIDAEKTKFTVENSTFTGNEAQMQGGVWRGFPPDAEILFKNCTFENNKAENGAGGCFYFPGDGVNSTITVDGGSFTGNSSLGASGGAFQANLKGDQGSLTLKNNVRFEKNTSAQFGGAVYVQSATDGTTVTVDTCTFTENGSDAENAVQSGGALYLLALKGTITVRGSTFEKNRALLGGAIYSPANNKGANMCVENCRFVENSAEGETEGGGALYLAMPEGTITLNGSTFEKNTAQYGGGAIFAPNVNKNTKLSVTGCSFAENSADGATKGDGGAMYLATPDGTVTLNGSTFTSNTARYNGGAVFAPVDNNGSKISVTGCSFTKNSSNGEVDVAEGGGALYLVTPNGTITLNGSKFEENTSLSNGGAVAVVTNDGAASVTIDTCTFKENSAERFGGGFFAYIHKADTLHVTGETVFSANVARLNAGGIAVYGDGGTVQLEQCDILNNECLGDFGNVDPKEYESTIHYNTGGVYIGETVTCYMNDALVTGNYVMDGFEDNLVGSGIGLCPNAEVALYPYHGTKVYNNGKGEGMDILAVPHDSSVKYVNLPRLYICDITPEGEAYNWEGLDGETARTGLYSWDQNVLNGIATAAAESDGAYTGETNRDPVGFKANIKNAGVMTLAVRAEQDPYKVRIVNNYTKSALYAAGGMMVNGTVISGTLGISVEKKTEGLSDADKASKEFKLRLSITGKDLGSKAVQAKFDKTNPPTTGTADFKKLSSGDGVYYDFGLKADQTITFKFEDSEKFFEDDIDYTFDLQETDSGGAAETRTTIKYFDDKNGEMTGELDSGHTPNPDQKLGTIEFVVTNVFKSVPDIPQTGDKSRPGLWALLACAGALGALLLVRRMRREP